MEDEEKAKTTTEEAQENTQTAAEKSSTEEPEKTFTQAELDRIVSERLARERKNQPEADELKAYREWKKSQQTEAEKAAEREKALQAAEAKAVNLEREKAIILAGVKGGDVDYVMFKVGKLEGDFEKNLSAFLTENSKFTEPETVIVDGVKHKPGASADPDEDLVRAMRKAAGLK